MKLTVEQLAVLADDACVVSWWCMQNGVKRPQQGEQIRKTLQKRLAEYGMAEPLEPIPGLTEVERKAQAARCGCLGADDYCVCQNAPDRTTLSERSAS